MSDRNEASEILEFVEVIHLDVIKTGEKQLNQVKELMSLLARMKNGPKDEVAKTVEYLREITRKGNALFYYLAGDLGPDAPEPTTAEEVILNLHAQMVKVYNFITTNGFWDMATRDGISAKIDAVNREIGRLEEKE